MNSVRHAIQRAEHIFATTVVVADSLDPRWQAVIAVGEFVRSDPDDVWNFARRWGAVDDDELRMAIATCLVEHLLEWHFAMIFPRMAEAARTSAYFADTVQHCWAFGQTESPSNRAQFDALLKELQRGAR